MTAAASAAKIATQPPDGKRGRERRGAYFTDDRLALAACAAVKSAGLWIGPSPHILEPGCGGGAFLRAAETTWPKRASLLGVDLVPACSGPGQVARGNVFAVKDERFDLVIGNPDFGIAENVVRHCADLLAPGGVVAFLLRLSFWETPARAQLFADLPLRAYATVSQRQSFTEDGVTDKLGLGLFIWQQGFHGRGEILPPIVWREGKKP